MTEEEDLSITALRAFSRDDNNVISSGAKDLCHFERSPKTFVISSGAKDLCHFERSPKGGVEKSIPILDTVLSIPD